MFNFMVCNFAGNSKNSSQRLKRLLNAQIENSLELGWDARKIIVISNIDYEYMGVKTLRNSLNDFCLTGSKMFGLKWFIDTFKVNEVIWSHDLDAWQNVAFEAPDFKDVGIARYSNTKFNGGSVFWKPESKDIIDLIYNTIVSNHENREEPTLNRILKSKELSNRVTVVDNTFNVGCSGYVVRYRRSLLPLRVCHFHPDNRIAWETHALDRNEIGEIGVTIRLERLIRRYYPDLACEVVTKKTLKVVNGLEE